MLVVLYIYIYFLLSSSCRSYAHTMPPAHSESGWYCHSLCYVSCFIYIYISFYLLHAAPTLTPCLLLTQSQVGIVTRYVMLVVLYIYIYFLLSSSCRSYAHTMPPAHSESGWYCRSLCYVSCFIYIYIFPFIFFLPLLRSHHASCSLRVWLVLSLVMLC